MKKMAGMKNKKQTIKKRQNNRSYKKRKKITEIYNFYRNKIKNEIKRNGYICGTMKELAECLKIPLNSLKISINSPEFKKDKIKQGQRAYYFISLAKPEIEKSKEKKEK
jgi:hypothetical protein